MNSSNATQTFAYPIPDELVSIVVPCYNVAAYVEQCITSLLAQTYLNLEVIAVNDLSTDDTGAVLDRMATGDKRLRVIHAPENGGPHAARKLGLESSRGEIIGFADSDDHVESHMYTTLVHALTIANADIAQCDMVKVNEQGAISYFNHRILTHQVLNDDLLARFAGGDLSIGSLCNKIFRRSIIMPAATRPIPSFIFVGEDYLVCVAAFILAKRIVLVPEVLYYYRQRDSSISHATEAPKAFITLLMCYTACIEGFALEDEEVLGHIDTLYTRQLHFTSYQMSSLTELAPYKQELRTLLSRISQFRPQALYALVHTYDTRNAPAVRLPLRYHLGQLRIVLQKIGSAFINKRS